MTISSAELWAKHRMTIKKQRRGETQGVWEYLSLESYPQTTWAPALGEMTQTVQRMPKCFS